MLLPSAAYPPRPAGLTVPASYLTSAEGTLSSGRPIVPLAGEGGDALPNDYTSFCAP
jgi:hypothetical protein